MMRPTEKWPQVAVVIPCYKVRRQIVKTVEAIGPEVSHIFVVDDNCPELSGEFVTTHCKDPRVVILRHDVNQGVGGAVMTGYKAAMDAGSEVIVKLDGDGQMDPALIPKFVEPILAGVADYTKGNRFFDLEKLESMPLIRIVGNACLSFMAKMSTGYWDLFDPTNGFTAIHASVASHLPFTKISRRFFFETDILFRLNTFRAVVLDIPMNSNYGDEKSNLIISRIIGEFFFKHLKNVAKRVFYCYFLRGFTLASIELMLGFILVAFGSVFGGIHWGMSAVGKENTPAGTVMLSALPIILGLQFLLAFVGHDMNSVPKVPLSGRRFYRGSIGQVRDVRV